ncbi:MAG: 2-oxo acid dehydrogenase subunit E2 [Sulfurovum sp.]|nr:2-oxo acid dehydrogenase subunit E2 [Sulfurovum sp.]
MVYEIVMPQLSDSMEEGKLISWKVKEGETVKRGDVIAEVESDKAIMEVQSFKNGVVSKLFAKEGDEVPVGTVIAKIEAEGSKEQGGSRSEPEAVNSEQPTVNNKEGADGREQAVDASKVGYTHHPERDAGSSLSHVSREMPNQVQYDKDHALSHTTTTVKSELTPVTTVTGSASPKAKALAARYGLHIEDLQKQNKFPTPAHEADILAFIQRRYFTPKAWKLLQRYHLSADLFALKEKISERDVLSHIEKYDIPLPKPISSNQKAVIATVTAAANKPVYHLYDALDATLINMHTDAQRTVTVWLLKLLAEAMMRHEVFRTTLNNETLQVWPHASVSVAMAAGEALYMPVIHKIDTMDTETLAQRLKELKQQVKAGKITVEQMRGSTFGLSNLGMTGIERFDAMVGGSDAGIAAIGSEKEGSIAVTLTLDHRVVNGFQAAAFMQTLKALCQDEMFFSKAG